MLKTKLAYMALGAVIASFGYFIGTFNNLNAEDEVARVKELIVSDKIIIQNDNGVCLISPEAFMHLLVGGGSTIISGSSVTLDSNESLPDHTGIAERTLEAPNLMLRKPQGKQIYIKIADKVSIKMSNGGLKSKTITVD